MGEGKGEVRIQSGLGGGVAVPAHDWEERTPQFQLQVFPLEATRSREDSNTFWRASPEYRLTYGPKETTHLATLRVGFFRTLDDFSDGTLADLTSWGFDANVGIDQRAELHAGVEFHFLDSTRLIIPGFYLGYDAHFGDSVDHTITIGARWAYLWNK